MYRANLPHTGAIHVPFDPLRCSFPRGRCGYCLLELGDRADGSPEVHRKVTEQLAVVRLARLYQSQGVNARSILGCKCERFRDRLGFERFERVDHLHRLVAQPGLRRRDLCRSGRGRGIRCKHDLEEAVLSSEGTRA